ncbi:hypothetical protein PTSG_02036 [Salpingoeca rosetta]|uniref:Sulfite exporter TauE/SafE n=1 Tax=Salpingoeca rosetta (strain ATCC 50818 / BSB-021) TaxID=946362 RepID=F2TZP4_SALR5|nr:uncharacterized protein PTSG_02036 [Salpingoeca rosetta]EGD79068.1 hypothetical protein PTSG_02036 [Salpingoeca rosetta]|eukprot:XP_004998024.1 hypothetical protein PTSG_02036 [Salpingoeca rosetta]
MAPSLLSLATCASLIIMMLLPLVQGTSGNLCKTHNYTCPSGGCPDDCSSPMYLCNRDVDLATNTTDFQCDHVDLFSSTGVGQDVGTLIVLFVFLGMSSAGGIGGGGLIIPILSVITLFPPYYAVPLSSTAIVGASIVQFFFQIRRRHPLPGAQHRRVIDFDTILMLLPLALAGTVVGVIFNTVSPDWLVLVVVIIVLVFTTFKTLVKGRELRRQEQEARALPRRSIVKHGINDPNSVNGEEDSGTTETIDTVGEDAKRDALGSSSDGNAASNGGPDTTAAASQDTKKGGMSRSTSSSSTTSRQRQSQRRSRSSLSGGEVLVVDYSGPADDADDNGAHNRRRNDSDDSMERVEMKGMSSSTADKQRLQEAREKLLKEEAAIPWTPMLITLFELGGVIVFSMIRGGSGTSLAGIMCGDGAYWGVQVSTFCFLLLCTFGGYLYVKRHHERRLAVNYTFVEGDIDYIGGGVAKYLFFALVAGMLAGFLGIGGGMVLAPLLLQFNMHPLVSSATTAYMTLFTSAGSFTQFVILNRVPYDYGIALFLLAAAASVVGQILLHSYVRRTGNSSVIAFILGFVIGLAAIMLLVSGSLQLKAAHDRGESFGFKPLCS